MSAFYGRRARKVLVRGDIVLNEEDREDPEGYAALAGAAQQLDYERFIRQYRPCLLRHARRIADNPEQGEDALQEALIEAHKQWTEVSTMERPLGWVLRVTEHKLFRLRHGRRPQKAAALTVSRETVTDFSEAFVENSELWDAVRQLPPRQREIVSLRHGFDLATSEVATHLGIKESTVRSNLSRAYERLRILLTSARQDKTL
jgi:RNA polymerase sigma factor (sigma-70 family)